jgi:pantoate kinase
VIYKSCVCALIAKPLVTSRAFSPGHITGIVETHDSVNRQDLLHQGSKGVGFSIDLGVTTTVSLYDDFASSYQIMINGRSVDDAEVSRFVVEEYLRFIRRPYHIRIEHKTDIPIGFGLGSSGAAALSLSFALNRALKVGLSPEQAAQIAHSADVACRTGLGTVIAEYSGGFEIRSFSGAPGIGRISKTKLNGYRAVILCMAPISTKLILSNDPNFDSAFSGPLPEGLRMASDISDFLASSNQFASNVGLTEGVCKEPMEAWKSDGFLSSVALFGATIFTLVPEELTTKAEQSVGNFEGRLITCGIDNIGARVL